MKNKSAVYEERFGIEKKRKKQRYVRWVLLIIVGLFIICGLTIGVQNIIRCSINSLAVTDNLNATWIGSLASYWGGVLGGIISGVLAVIGVAWTIKYYKNSDAAKTRIEHMPFLMAEVKGYSENKNIGSVTGDVELYKIDSKIINTSPINKDEQRAQRIIYYRIALKNVGQGFASTTVIYTGENIGGQAFYELIQVDCTSELCFEIHLNKEIKGDKINFAVCYVDCMTNEYIQEYCVQWKGDHLNDVKIQQGYPLFLGQTHDI